MSIFSIFYIHSQNNWINAPKTAISVSSPCTCSCVWPSIPGPGEFAPEEFAGGEPAT